MAYNIIKTDTFSKNLTEMGKSMLKDRYLFKNEDLDDLPIRVACAYASNEQHANRLYKYISNLWFMPSTPILSNAGSDRGLPISCNLNSIGDSLDDINEVLCNENFYLSSRGAGIGTDFSLVRPNGTQIKNKGITNGIVPFIKIQEAMSRAISQGGIRGGTSAAYLHVSHPEILEFIDIRRPTGGDHNRKVLSTELHHGVILSDEFMEAVSTGSLWNLVNPQNKDIIETIPARDIWFKLLTARLETGEPYLIFEGNANKSSLGYPEIFNFLNLKITMSNLCSEIMLPTRIDYNNERRTAICCLSSLNLDKWEEWKHNEIFLKDVLLFLDNVLTDYIKKAPIELKQAVYSAVKSRTIGLGVMGFHSLLQQKGIAFESVIAKVLNKKIFSYLKSTCDKLNEEIGVELGEPEDFKYARSIGYKGGIKRFATLFAIAPTASISNICGGVSPGIEPYAANIFTQKTKSGSFTVVSKYLIALLEKKGYNNDEIKSSISINHGSVQHLDFLTQEEKDVFKTAYEINQGWILSHASDRQPFIDQGQSLNLFLRPDIEKKELHSLHYSAWKQGLKSLYYCRSVSMQRADVLAKMNIKSQPSNNYEQAQYSECLACQ